MPTNKCLIEWCPAECSTGAHLCPKHLEDFTFSPEGERCMAAEVVSAALLESMLADYVERISKEGAPSEPPRAGDVEGAGKKS